MVTGKITVDGEPMEGITVTFAPSGSNEMGAYGMTDATGSYKLTTGGAPFGTGAIPGPYIVTFSKVTSRPGMSLAEFEAGVSRQPAGPPKVIHLIPEKFSNPNTVGFDPVEVKKGGKNNFDFNLETK